MKGYLIFTTHDRDELDATFIPETDPIIGVLMKVDSDPDMEKANIELDLWHADNPDAIKWQTQTRCATPWPFADHEILATFYHLVY